jgi:hypothetical protein
MQLKDLVIEAFDGDIGTASQLYFDDETWTVRYLVVNTGGWLAGRNVLISPYAITGVDWQALRVNVSLTKKQVENSPDIDTHRPVSRQHEVEHLGYYGYPNYWGGPYLWGPTYYPMGLANPSANPLADLGTQVTSEDSHLRSTSGVSGYEIQATDSELGHVKNFILDDESWEIRYLEVATRNWWPGKTVLISPAWIERVSWAEGKVYVNLSREKIKSAPSYNESEPITREYETLLYFHYARAPYWVRGAAQGKL